MRERRGSAQERLDQLLAVQSLLAEVARDIGPAVQLHPVLTSVLTAMRSLVRFRGGSIGLVDERGVYIAAADPPVSPEVAMARVPVGSGLAGRCVATRRPVYSGDLDTDERVDQALRKTGSNRGMRSYLAVPLVCLGESIGVLQVDSEDVDAFDKDDLRVLEGLATQVAGAIESARRFEEMRRLDEARALFIARVSHELRTPLTILRGFTTSLVENPERFEVSDPAGQLLAKIDRAGTRLQLLVEELLTVTVAEAAALAPQIRTVHLAGLVEGVVAGSTDPAALRWTCDPDAMVRLDASLTDQVLSVLVENALEHAGTAEVAAAVDGHGDVCFRIVDHGPGIPDERKRSVFERFSRGDQSTPGWGLGLSLAADLVRAQRGTIDLEDTPGGGITFVVRIPGG